MAPHDHLYASCWGAAAVLWAACGARALIRRAREGGDRLVPGRVIALLAATLVATLVGAKLQFIVGSVGRGAMLDGAAAAGAGGAQDRLLAPGLRITGGLVAGGLTVTLLGPPLFGRRLGALAILDALAPPAGFASALGRLGCLAAGCCFGTPSDLPWSITYPLASRPYLNHLAQGLIAETARRSLPVHPLPIYLAAAGLLAGTAARILDRLAPRDGNAALGFALVMATLRIAIEPLRETRLLDGISGQQGLSSAIAASAAIALACHRVLPRNLRNRAGGS